jgi:ribonuclease R
MVFTIDPLNSTDMEDGLSLEPLGDGLYELGVHISDVTSYKHLINRREIANKGASFYLPHKTIHMMPPKLVNQLALKPKKRRLAFSAFFAIDLTGKVHSSRF